MTLVTTLIFAEQSVSDWRPLHLQLMLISGREIENKVIASSSAHRSDSGKAL